MIGINLGSTFNYSNVVTSNVASDNTLVAFLDTSVNPRIINYEQKHSIIFYAVADGIRTVNIEPFTTGFQDRTVHVMYLNNSENSLPVEFRFNATRYDIASVTPSNNTVNITVPSRSVKNLVGTLVNGKIYFFLGSDETLV